MKKLTLIRKETGDQGTFGTLDLDGLMFYTGELPWRNNAHGASSIPAGTYLCTWGPSPKFGRDLYHLQDVPGRDHILIHPANRMGDVALGFKSDLNGCLALGLLSGEMEGQKAILQSRPAVQQFEQEMGKEDFELTILNEYSETGEPAGGSVG